MYVSCSSVCPGWSDWRWSVGKITGLRRIPSLPSIYELATIRQANKTVNDASPVLHAECELTPSGKRYSLPDCNLNWVFISPSVNENNKKHSKIGLILLTDLYLWSLYLFFVAFLNHVRPIMGFKGCSLGGYILVQPNWLFNKETRHWVGVRSNWTNFWANFDNSVWSHIDVELTLNAQQLQHPFRLFISLHLNTSFALVLCYYWCSFYLILQSVSQSAQANTLHSLQLAALHFIFPSAINRKQKCSPPTLLASSPMLSFWHPSSPPLTALEWQWCAHSFSPQFKSATEWPSELDYVRWRILLFLVSGDFWGFTREIKHTKKSTTQAGGLTS